MALTKLSRSELKERWYRRRFLLPNLVTVGNLFCGFLAIVYAIGDRFDQAAYALLVAIVLDGLDGRVARKFNATSKFGVEFDSFSDLVSFGVAPAVLMYLWCYRPIADEFGVFVCFLFLLCAASRLARFNISQENLVTFQGLPTPGSAGMVIALVYAVHDKVQSPYLVGAMTLLMLLLSYLQVSNIEFPSIKQIKLRSMGVPARIYLGGLVALIFYQPRIGFFVLGLAYVLSGPLKAWRQRKLPKAAPPAGVVNSDTKNSA